jgi:hypothetical protein
MKLLTKENWPYRVTKIKADATKTVDYSGRARAVRFARKIAPLYLTVHVDKLDGRKGKPVQRVLSIDMRGNESVPT